jgi:hypothetical protein
MEPESSLPCSQEPATEGWFIQYMPLHRIFNIRS